MKILSTNWIFSRKQLSALLTGFFLFVLSTTASAQLGVYSFTGSGSCPNQNPAINSQPANAVFSNYSSVNTSCQGDDNVFTMKDWNNSATLDVTEYNQFTITPNAGFTLTLSSISFAQYLDQNPSGTTNWYLRSSVDGYATDLATGTATGTSQTPTITLPGANFTNIGAVTFRLYLTGAESNGRKWTNDEVTINGTVNSTAPANPANPTSNSPQCSTPGVTMNFTGSAPAGETWYWQTSATGTSTANSVSSYIVNTSGTYYVRSQNNTTLAWSTGAGSITVAITSNVGTPVFTLGTSSTRCIGIGSTNCAATAANSTNITYSLDANSELFNTVDATGKVTWFPAWVGTAIITATATGCGVTKTATDTVITMANVGTPVFTLGATSTRCQGAGVVRYDASGTNVTSVTYSLSGGGTSTINPATGDVTWAAAFSGNATITATASGCGTPKTATHTVTVNPTLTTPVFTAGATSTRCQGAGSVTYGAISSAGSTIVYSVDATTSGFPGNYFDPATGTLIFDAAWSGPSTITATASGCGAPKTATHTVTTYGILATPAFTAGATSTRCQGAGSFTYDAFANNNQGMTYSLSGGGSSTIVTTTGQVTWSAAFTGTATITVTAAGCTGPKTATHTVTVNPTITTPVFASGATSARCQGAGTASFTATNNNNAEIRYTLDGTSSGLGNTIDSLTGQVTYLAGWTGVAVITATGGGCNGPKTATHSDTTKATVGTPVFIGGATSSRCQGAGTVSFATNATASTSKTYSLDATANAFPGNGIVQSTGVVTYAAGWVGIATISVYASGCNGPSATVTHTDTTKATVITPVFISGATSARCQGAGTVNFAATNNYTTAIRYKIDATSSGVGNIIDSLTGDLTYTTGWTGVTTITATGAGCNGPKTATHTDTTKATVATPVFASGSTSTRCQAAGTVTYAANATAGSTFVYSVDATTSTFAGNSFNPLTGALTYAAGWSGPSTISVYATGCNGPSATATHIVTTTPTITTPAFDSGATSIRCQGAATVLYRATNNNNAGITYSLSPSGASTGTIVPSTGQVTWNNTYNGTATITATATGCNGPKTATHTVTVRGLVATPVFNYGSTSSRCHAAETITYTAGATNATGITYSLDAASLAAGNTIDTTNGAVTYVANWTTQSVITATAIGCNGPKTANHTVTNNKSVGQVAFTNGATSIRCQGAALVQYPATVTDGSILYTLDATSSLPANGNSINGITGIVSYAAGWSGTSVITATASGCYGPTTATHTVTITPTVGTPVFNLGASSTRCQGANTVTYTANATNIDSIRYSLDVTSTNAGNFINTGSGLVTYVANWTGTSTITARAYGCNGPKTSTHTVTSTATVSAPVFAMGLQSVRTQGAATITYDATATRSDSIIYSLDAASLSSGNTITRTSGAVTWTAAWYGTSVVKATAYGCNGPVTSNHIVNINPSVVQSPLYLSTPGQILDRIDPVATNITTTMQTAVLSSTGTTNTTFTLNPALCSNLTIKAQTIAVTLYVTIASGTMPVNPNITALIKYGSTTIISLTNPVYNSSNGILSWSASLPADATVPAGQAIDLVITTAQAGVTFNIDYHSKTKPSRISLFPISTFIDFISFDVFDAAYPFGNKKTNGLPNQTYYVRAKITTPFGYKDITGMDLSISPGPGTVPVNCVDSSACTRTYEYPFFANNGNNAYYLLGTAKEGYENIIKNSELLTFQVCTTCPPVAFNDSATGAGGTPLTVNVLSNDYDPNNNMRISSLAITVQPRNGTGFISNGRVVYLPNGTYAGRDTLTYQICDSTSLCATAQVFVNINPVIVDPCSEATKSHVYYMPFPENEVRLALDSSASVRLVSNNIRTVISIKIPYPGVTIVWDQWEDGYEINALNPQQSTTQVWGDGNPYNGIAPGYATDIIPAGGSIVLDDTIPTNPRVQANLFYDGRDKITSSGQITVTQVCGEPSIIGLQCMKTNVSPEGDFGTSFTIPVGEDFNSQDFRYTALFIRAAHDSTVVQIDKDNNGTLETTATINEGQVLFVAGGVKSGATVTSSADIGVELHFGGKDSYSSREVPVYPATWYSNTYYSPVPTTNRAAAPIKDTSVVMLYNSLNRPLTVNWTSGVPSSGSLTIPAKTTIRFPLAVSATAAYKFTNPTGESFTAIEIVDSYTPGGGGNIGQDFDWSFNLIAENRLTDFATIAWAPGSTNGMANHNPIWVTPTGTAPIYVKYDGNVTGTTGSTSPCGMKYDVVFNNVNALTFIRVKDPNDNDQSGIAIYTCAAGVKIAAVYGEDPSTAPTANPAWDVGSTIQPFCKQKLIFANDDYSRTIVNQPVTIPILLNDFGWLAVVDPTSVTTAGLLQPGHGTVIINSNGTVIYTPNPGYVGKDTFEYNVCSTPSPIVCDIATVYVDIAICPAPFSQNIISGQVFIDKNDDGINNDGGTGLAGPKVYFYVDGNSNNVADANELEDSVTVDASGMYQFIRYPERTVEDDFDGVGGARTCNNGSDGTSAWLTDWVDAGDPSTGAGNAAFCVTPALSQANTDAEIYKDGAFSNAIRLKDNNVSVTRRVNLAGAAYAFLSFSYRRKVALALNHDVIVQASKDGVTFGTVFTIAGDANSDAAYVNIYNQDITQYATANTYIRFLTNNNVADGDTVYIDNVKIQFIRYPIRYITKLDVTTVPAYHHTTTVLQHVLNVTSAQTCLAPYDFGIAKNKITISGTLFHDANGNVDGAINGPVMGTIAGSPVYAYLVDSTGKVVRRTTLNSSTGNYSFTDADVYTRYTLRLSSTSVNLNDVPPTDLGAAAITANWLPTGERYGRNNAAGLGLNLAAPSGSIAITTTVINVDSANVGIELAPNSDDRTINYTTNVPGVKYDITGGLTGSDSEDGILGSGKTYKITRLPVGAKLYYNNALVTLNQVITAFNPALLKIDPDDITHTASFMYASRDAAGVYDPTPATIIVNWNQTLPVKLISFSGRLNGTKVDLNWVTANELNTKQFEVERSADGVSFTKIATVAARGNSSTATSYDTVDPSPLPGVNYYRLKMVDIDGKFEYSQIVIIRIDNSTQLITKVAPNPFTGKIDVYLTLTHNTPVDFRFIDINGRLVFSKSVKGLKGFNWFTINDLDKLPSAPYILHIKTDDANIIEKLIKQQQ